MDHGWPGTEPSIGTRNESTLHRDLKDWWAQPGDRFEVAVEGYVVDLVRGDTCVEIQTRRLAALGPKLDRLLAEHHVHVLHPIAVDTYIHRLGQRPRRSPRHGTVYDVFGELVGVPTLLDHPNLTLEVLMVHVDALKVHDPLLRRRRGGWRTVDRRLRCIVERHGLRTPTDLADLLPSTLPASWTSADLANAAGIGRRTAQQMAYVLRANDLVAETGRTRAGVTHRTR